MATKPKLGAFLVTALVLGVVGFGGGYAVAMRVRRALVLDRGWLADHEFDEALAVASSLPGTTATNLLSVLGYRFGGVTGAVSAAALFLAPSVALMVAFAAFYTHARELAALGWVLDGMGVATVGVIAAVAVQLRHMAKGRTRAALAAVSFALLALRVLNLLEVIALAGLVGALTLRPPGAPPRDGPPPSSSLGAFAAVLPALALSPLAEMLVVFARIGVATFGGGIAMIAPMEHEIVGVHGWLRASAFSDAIVLGQITPGPIAISATFIGWRVHGPAGAAVATLGMFGPPLLLSIAAARSIPWFRQSPALRGMLAGISPAVVGAIAASSVALFRTSVHGPFGAVAAALAFAVLTLRPKTSPLVPIAVIGALSAILRLR